MADEKDDDSALKDTRSYRSEPDDRLKDKGDEPGKDADAEADAKDGDGDDEEGKPKKSPLKNPVVLTVGGIVVLVLVVALFFYWRHARKYVSTDDAYIDTHIVHLAPQIAGRVTGVYVDDNALVGTNQLLVQVDPIDVNTRVDQAIAQRAQAVAQREQGLAAKDQAFAQIRTQEKSYEQARAQIPGLEAQAAASGKDYDRYLSLQRVNPLAVARSQLDNARAQAAQTASQAEAQRKAAAAAAAAVQQAGTQVEAANAQIKGADAQIGAADAVVNSAKVNAGYARLVAPLIGHVAKKNVAIGSYVQPGQELMAIVPLQMWVTANFKENQLKLMRKGQPVDIKVDAYPDVKFHGHVDSIQRGAGQAFGILPAENATGNFVKVVQRVPVKIVIDNLDDAHHPIGPGMSVSPRVKVR